MQLILSDFSCPKNHEIEELVRKNAIEFARRRMSITYLVADGGSRIVGARSAEKYFSYVVAYTVYSFIRAMIDNDFSETPEELRKMFDAYEKAEKEVRC